MERLQTSGEILMEAIAYGDAAGLPAEMKSAAYIQRTHGRLTRLIAPDDNKIFGPGYDAGTWSDDTQLSLAIAEALIKANGFDLDAIAEAHIYEYGRIPKVFRDGEWVSTGWGKGTQSSVERLIEGIPPTKSGSEKGVGNGILMKMAPLAFWHAARGIDTEERYANYDALTHMTHATDVAKASTRLHGDVLNWLLQDETSGAPIEEFSDFVIEREQVHKNLAGDAWTADLSYLRNAEDMTPELVLQNSDGKGFYVPQTIAMAYGAFIAGYTEYEHSVYTAVNLGGDADSIASIVGAMSALANGEIDKPEDFALINERLRLQTVSKKLTDLALKGA